MLVVKGGTVVDTAGAFAADVLIDGERIAAVQPNIDPTGHELIDAGGALVIPGGIDVHTHFDLPVGAVRSADDFESGTVAAACGGTTCIVDFAGAGREPPLEALRSWHEKADGKAAIDYGFHLTVTSVPQEAEDAESLFRWFVSEGVTSVKLYLAYPERLMVDEVTLGRAMVAAEAAGVLVCVHAEDGLEAERRTEALLAAGETGPGALPRARPPEIEAAAIRMAASLAGKVGTSLYVVHLSSAAGLQEVRAARAAGARVLAETCPQYLYLTEAALHSPPAEAANFVCVPPVRSNADGTALWGALDTGEIAAVSTDHCPFTTADRHRGTKAEAEAWASFAEVPGGLPGVETRLSLVFQGVRDGRLTPGRWVDLVAAAPARLFGLSHRKGSLSPGLDADVVVFDPDARKRLDPGSLHMRTDHSPYADVTVTGWPALTIARGRIVARGGEPADIDHGRGRFVRRLPRGWSGHPPPLAGSLGPSREGPLAPGVAPHREEP
ncbi:MAG: dihydropyrimidinase [Actinomycetota bacterium]